MSYIIPFAAGLLACLAPTLSFAGVNAPFFSSRQIAGAIILSLCLGIILGIGLCFMPPWAAGAAAGLVFAAMSERMLASFLPQKWAVAGAILAIGAICAALAHLAGLVWVMFLMLAYAAFAVLDLLKRSKLPKQSVFESSGEMRAGMKKGLKSNVQLKTKPNIYVLFLESFHSAYALKKIYGEDDAGFEDFLKTRGFTIFQKGLSNACWTQHSMQTLLHMAHYDNKATGMPEAIRHLSANGYELQLLDTYAYTFNKYFPWADWTNFRIPAYVSWLYDRMLPFFMQSKYLMAITANIDPFDDNSDFASVKSAFEKRAALDYERPQCFIMRFGAQHVGNQYKWTKKSDFASVYLPSWRRAAADARDMIDTILRHDGNALIMAMGDHGPHFYEDSWRDNMDCNLSIRGNGLEPADVCLDLSGVLLAARPPAGDPIPQETMSPCNLFRLAFELLGGDSPALKRIPNTTFHHDSHYPRPFVIAREGVPLQNWEVAQDRDKIEQRITALEKEPDNPDRILAVGISLRDSGLIREAGDFLLPALQKTGAIDTLGAVTGDVLLRQGKIREIMQNLGPALEKTENIEFFKLILRAMAILGAERAAAAMAEKRGPAIGLDAIDCLALQAQIHEEAGNLEQAAAVWARLAAMPYSHKRNEYEKQSWAMRNYANCLDAQGRTDEALALLDHMIAVTAWSNNYYDTPFQSAIGLSLRAETPAQTLARFEKAIPVMTIPWPETLHLWHAGILERTGQKQKAFDALREVAERNAGHELLAGQFGLFLLRNHYTDPSLRPFKKAGYTALDAGKKLLPAIFDEQWFMRKYGKYIPQGMAPMQFYIHYGRVLGLDPSPYLNTVFYCLTQWDIMHSGYDPVWHYLTCSPYESRDPSLAFNTAAYLYKHPKVNWPSVNPLRHFLASRPAQN